MFTIILSPNGDLDSVTSKMRNTLNDCCNIASRFSVIHCITGDVKRSFKHYKPGFIGFVHVISFSVYMPHLSLRFTLILKNDWETGSCFVFSFI